MISVKRGEIYLVDFGDEDENIIRGIRPALVIQNDMINKFAPTVIVAPLTSNTTNIKLDTHVIVNKELGLPSDSLILLEQVKAISKNKLKEKILQVSDKLMIQVESALKAATSNEIIHNMSSSVYKEVYSPEYDLKEIKEMIENSNRISSRFKEWIYAGVIGAIIGFIINLVLPF